MILLTYLTQNQDSMLIAAYPVFSMPDAAHFYQAMLSWQSTLVLLVLSLCIYFLCQAGMSRAAVLSRERSRDSTGLEEMHDTLIQGVQGLMLSLQATASQLPAQGQGRAQIETLLDNADGLLAQGRQAMQDEQDAAAPGGDLEQALAELACILAEKSQTSFCLSINGHGVPFTLAARNVTYQLARTAMINAAVHARAKRVEVELCYALGMFGLRIRDDGKGYAKPGSASGGKHGYPCLQQILAQVCTLQTRLDIWSAPGSGTELSLTLSHPALSSQQFKRFSIARASRFLQTQLYRQ
ncbi:sensor histidine kinase [Undibacterium sp. Ji42W]